METTTSFDLNKLIQLWRENLASSPAFRSENLDELESHLRDSMAALQTSGLSEEESFIVAEKRIGKGGKLEREFAKVNASTVWLDRAVWMLIGILVWQAAASLTNSIAWSALTMGWSAVGHGSNQGVPVAGFELAPLFLAVSTKIAAIAWSVAFCWLLIVRLGPKMGKLLKPSIPDERRIITTCAILSMAFLVIYLISFGLRFYTIKFAGMEAVGRASLYTNASDWIIGPVEIIVAVAFTLMLIRKKIQSVRI